MNEESVNSNEYIAKITKWANPPSLIDLQQELAGAESEHSKETLLIQARQTILNGGVAKQFQKNKSTIRPKMLKRLLTWRIPALINPYISTNRLFTVIGNNTAGDKKDYAIESYLNYLFNKKTNRNKLIKSIITTAATKGTVIIKAGWAKREQTYKGKTVAVVNKPANTVIDHSNILIDPNHNGDPDNIKFFIEKSYVNKTELYRNNKAITTYHNLDKIGQDEQAENVITTDAIDPEKGSATGPNYKDEAKKLYEMHTYWGYLDINNDHSLMPVVISWIGNTIIRMEESPYTFYELPFTVIPYLIKENSVYGETEFEELEEYQQIRGSSLRAMLDSNAKIAAGQSVTPRGAINTTEKILKEKGLDYTYDASFSHDAISKVEVGGPVSVDAYNLFNLAQTEAEDSMGVTANRNANTTNKSATEANHIYNATEIKEGDISANIKQGLIRIAKMTFSLGLLFLTKEDKAKIPDNEYLEVTEDYSLDDMDIEIRISSYAENQRRIQILSMVMQTYLPNADPAVQKIMLTELLRLQNMHQVIEELDKPQEPNPVAQIQQQLGLEQLQANVAATQAKAGKDISSAQENQVDMELKGAKIEETIAKTDLIEQQANNTGANTIKTIENTDHTNALEQQQAKDTGTTANENTTTDAQKEQEAVNQALDLS